MFDRIREYFWEKKAARQEKEEFYIAKKDQEKMLGTPRYDLYTQGYRDIHQSQNQTILPEDGRAGFKRNSKIMENIFDQPVDEITYSRNGEYKVSMRHYSFVEVTPDNYNDVITDAWTFWDNRAKKGGPLTIDDSALIKAMFVFRIDASDIEKVNISDFRMQVEQDIACIFRDGTNAFEFASKYPVVWNTHGDKEMFGVSSGNFFSPPEKVNYMNAIKTYDGKHFFGEEEEKVLPILQEQLEQAKNSQTEQSVQEKQ